MSGVLEDPAARQDVVIRRGARTQWAIRWEQSTDGGRTFEQVDLAGHGARARLTSPTGEAWLDLDAYISPDNLVVITTNPDDFADPAWASRSGGVWLCDLITPDDAVIRHGEGYVYLEE